MTDLMRRGCAGALALLSAIAAVVPATAASQLSLGPKGIQALIATQLFNRAGRWYLLDDGGICYTYLESPRTHLTTDRLVLDAHLVSRLGQRIGGECAGADFAAHVTLSGKLRAGEHTLILDDIRIDRVDDEATRNALNLALQVAPQTVPRTASIDVFESMRKQTAALGDLPLHVEQFHILNLATRPDAVAIQFDVSLSAP
jgi:hypothetical protein